MEKIKSIVLFPFFVLRILKKLICLDEANKKYPHKKKFLEYLCADMLWLNIKHIQHLHMRT